MLETLGDPTIHRMAIEKPEKNETGWFDMPELDELDVDKVLENIKQTRKSFKTAITNAADAQELGMPVEIPERDIFWAGEYLILYRDEELWHEFSQTACSLKRIGIDPPVTSEDMQKMTDRLQNFPDDKTPSRLMLARNVKILGGDLKLTPEDEANFRYYLNEIKKFKTGSDFDMTLKKVREFIEAVRLMRELDLVVEISPEELAEWQKWLQLYYEAVHTFLPNGGHSHEWQ